MILLIGGFDPTGNAGLLKDAKTCRFLHHDSFLFPTALTAQNDKAYFGTQILSQCFLEKQWRAVPFKEIQAIKIGMLGNQQVVRFLIEKLVVLKKKRKEIAVVWDPVFASSSGGELLNRSGQKLAMQKLLPLVNLVTPNASEMKIFLANDNSLKNPQAACELFFTQYHKPVYLKGGHLKNQAEDYFFDGQVFTVLSSHIVKRKLRGTGCAFASAVACFLAQGQKLEHACQSAKRLMVDMFDGKVSR